MIQTIRYINHSGFLVETERAILIFDYFTDPAGVLAEYAQDERPFFFFVSHAHYDHWNLGVFDFESAVPPVYYLDESCRATLEEALDEPPTPRIHYMKPGEDYEISRGISEVTGLERILAFGSTDEGVSVLIKMDDEWIFHAGDLNHWDWQDDQSELVERAYRGELAKIRDTVVEDGRELKIAFIPVDQRLEETALSGAKIFLEYLVPRLLIPMHLNGGTDLPERLTEAIEAEGAYAGQTRVVGLTVPGLGCDCYGELEP